MSGVGRGVEKIPGNTRAAERLALFCAGADTCRQQAEVKMWRTGGGEYIDANVGEGGG